MTQHDADQREFDAWCRTQPKMWAEEYEAMHPAWHASRAALRQREREATEMEIVPVLEIMQIPLPDCAFPHVEIMLRFRAELARLGLRVVKS